MNKTILAISAVFLLALVPSAIYGQTDSFSIQFRSGVFGLDEAQNARLDSFLFAARILPGTSISIVGYADEPGGTELNNTIAARRAASVKDYLLASGINRNNIIECKGVGNLVPSGEDAYQRRVDILLGKAAVPAVVSKSVTEVAKKEEVAAKPKRSLKELKNMKPGELMVIENLQFKLSTNEFEPVSRPILAELAEVLKELPEMKIKLEGHICCGGKTDSSKRLETGYELSLSRARAVLQYLTSHGISSSRLSCVGFGYLRPKVFPERSLADSYLNRRVEIRVVSNK
jgi:outer membrane protein OmpA-like peptidoglycan-associated protein